jgi:hypothetical protein
LGSASRHILSPAILLLPLILFIDYIPSSPPSCGIVAVIDICHISAILLLLLAASSWLISLQSLRHNLHGRRFLPTALSITGLWNDIQEDDDYDYDYDYDNT